MAVEPSERCRLCHSGTSFFGRRTILGKYPISYFQCGECQSLQTELPFWLEEAYGNSGQGLDVGACQRGLNLALEVSAVLAVLDFGTDRLCLDYGSGMGLFARLMRDRGYQFHAFDKYKTPCYMDRFSSSLAEQAWSLVTAFEVFEHLANPRRELADIFRSAHDIVLCATEFWTGQGLDWWYLAPDCGQHVFFYSPQSFRWLAQEHGFTLIDCSTIKVFLRRGFCESSGRSGREIAARLADRNGMARLSMKLFQEHQRDPFQWVQKDYARLVGGANLDGLMPDRAVTPVRPMWKRIVRRLRWTV